MPFLIFVVLMWLIMKCTGLLFRIIGKAFSLTFGVLGYLLLGVIAIVGFGVSILAGAVVVIAGILALIFVFLL